MSRRSTSLTCTNLFLWSPITSLSWLSSLWGIVRFQNGRFCQYYAFSWGKSIPSSDGLVAALADDLGRTVSLVKAQVPRICHNIGDTVNWRTEERRLRLISKGGGSDQVGAPLLTRQLSCLFVTSSSPRLKTCGPVESQLGTRLRCGPRKLSRYSNSLDGPGIESQWGLDFPDPSRPALEPIQFPVQLVPAVKRALPPTPREETRCIDHSPPCSAEAKERVGLYLCSLSLSLSLWAVVACCRWPLLLASHIPAPLFLHKKPAGRGGVGRPQKRYGLSC